MTSIEGLTPPTGILRHRLWPGISACFVRWRPRAIAFAMALMAPACVAKRTYRSNVCRRFPGQACAFRAKRRMSGGRSGRGWLERPDNGFLTRFNNKGKVEVNDV